MTREMTGIAFIQNNTCVKVSMKKRPIAMEHSRTAENAGFRIELSGHNQDT